MATNFPASLDTLTNPTSSDSLSSPSHSAQHANVNDAVEALQAKVGVDSSAVSSSLDYKVAQLEAISHGKILQVVSAVTTTEVTTTTTGFVDTGLSATITPTSASSDILVFMTAPLTMENSAQYASVTIFRGTVASGTNLATSGTTVLGNGYSASVTGGLRETLTPFVVDSPATTSATTYTGAFSTNTGTARFVKGGNPGAYMLLMEVAS